MTIKFGTDEAAEIIRQHVQRLFPEGFEFSVQIYQFEGEIYIEADLDNEESIKSLTSK